jgi:hypothetical protein
VEGTKLFYSLKKEHFGKARTVMEFSYVLESEQEVDKLLAALDHAVLVSTKLAERNNNADLTLLDEEVHATYSRYQSTISIEAQRLEVSREREKRRGLVVVLLTFCSFRASASNARRCISTTSLIF